MKRSPPDDVRQLRNALRENDVSLGEIADLSEVDTGAVVRQLAGDEPLEPVVRRVSLALLRDRRIASMINVINILNVEGETELAETLTNMVNGWLDD